MGDGSCALFPLLNADTGWESSRRARGFLFGLLSTCIPLELSYLAKRAMMSRVTTLARCNAARVWKLRPRESTSVDKTDLASAGTFADFYFDKNRVAVNDCISILASHATIARGTPGGSALFSIRPSLNRNFAGNREIYAARSLLCSRPCPEYKCPRIYIRKPRRKFVPPASFSSNVDNERKIPYLPFTVRLSFSFLSLFLISSPSNVDHLSAPARKRTQGSSLRSSCVSSLGKDREKKRDLSFPGRAKGAVGESPDSEFPAQATLLIEPLNPTISRTERVIVSGFVGQAG